MNPIPVKICTSCKKEKTLDLFGKNKSQPDSHHYYCKKCVINMRELNKEKNQAYFKAYREKNLDQLKPYHKTYRKGLSDDFFHIYKTEEEKQLLIEAKREKQQKRQKEEDYKRQRRLYFKYKYQKDVQYRLKKQFESKLNYLLNSNDASDISKNLIGCTIPEFKIHLEAKFLPTMTWENYGTEWQLDRIIPFCSFDLTDEEQQKKCFHYTNVQPLFIITKVIDGVTYVGNMNKNKF